MSCVSEAVEEQTCLIFLSPPAGRLYAMQTGMKLDSKTPECRKFLVKLMDQLETVSWIPFSPVPPSVRTLFPV